MIAKPARGQRVQVWYATKPKRRGGVAPAEVMSLHGRIGIVRIVGRGPGPRNHGVEVGGRVYGVPCGNLRKLDVEV